MAFSPGTKKMLEKYGQNTGIFPEEKKGPRMARSTPPAGPSSMMYDPSAQKQTQALQQMFPTANQFSPNAKPPAQMGMGQNPASIEGVAPLMQHPLVSDSFFDDNQS